MIKIIEGNLRVLLSETRESDNGKKLTSNRKGQNQTGLTISNNLGMSRKGRRNKASNLLIRRKQKIENDDARQQRYFDIMKVVMMNIVIADLSYNIIMI